MRPKLPQSRAAGARCRRQHWPPPVWFCRRLTYVGRQRVGVGHHCRRERVYGVRGRPGWPPSRLALVTIFQKAGNLTGRQAAESVRTRIDWKYALGLAGGDPGFDHSSAT